jgi:hypothetical protein
MGYDRGAGRAYYKLSLLAEWSSTFQLSHQDYRRKDWKGQDFSDL